MARRGFVARRRRFAQRKPPATWSDKPCRVGRVRLALPAGLLFVFFCAALDLDQPVLMVPFERLRHPRFAQAAGQVAHGVVGPALEEPAHDSKFMTGATSSEGRKKLSASRNASIVETPREISRREYPISDNGVVSSNAMLNMSTSTRIQLATP